MKLTKNLRFIRDLNRKYIPGLVVVVALVVAGIIGSIVLSARYVDAAMESHAHQAAERVFIQLDLTLQSGFDVLDTLAGQNVHGKVSNKVLKNVTYSTKEELGKRLNMLEVGEGEYLIYGDGQLYLGISTTDTNVLYGEMERTRLEKALSTAYQDSYGYAMFDLNTGISLINNSGFESENYYDGLTELRNKKAVTKLLNNPSAAIRFKAPSGESMFLVQKIEGGCGVVLLLPPALLGNIGSSDFVALVPGICGMGLMLAALIWFLAMTMKYARQYGKSVTGRIISWREMAETVALRGNFGMFELEIKGEDADEITYFFNSLPLPDDGARERMVYSIAELESLLNVDTADIGKLSQVISDMKDGDVAETEINCALSTGLQCLKFEMQRDAEGAGRVTGCVYDCSDDERLRRTEVSEGEFIEAMRPRSEVIWHINATRNKWKILDTQLDLIRNFFASEGVGGRRAYDEDIDDLFRTFIHPDEFETFAEHFTCEAIKRAFNEGKTEFSMDFRTRNSTEEDWRWVRFVARVWSDSNNRDIKANVCSVNVNQQKRAELERRERADVLHRSLTAINGMFFGLFYVDMVTGMCYAAKPYRGETGTRFAAPFKELFDRYKEESVHPEDRVAFGTILDLWYIRKTMVQNTHLMQLNYRSKMGDVYYWSTVSVQAAQFENGTVTKVVVALQHTHGADTSRHEANT